METEYWFFKKLCGDAIDKNTFLRLGEVAEAYLGVLEEDALIFPKDSDSKKTAVCRLIQVDYDIESTLKGDNLPKTSEGLGNYSYSVNTAGLEKTVSNSQKSRDARRLEVIRTYYNIVGAVR